MAKVDEAGQARVDEAGLFPARDHPDMESCLFAQPVQELLSVEGLSGRRRSHRHDLVGPVPLRQLHELPAHQHRLLHRLGLEPAIGKLALAQTSRLPLFGD